MMSSKEYYYDNHERMLELHRGYREKTREQRKILDKLYRESPRGRSIKAAQEGKRRASKLNATPPWLTAEDSENILKIYEYAQALGYHVDHIVPLQNNSVCGLHVPWNLRAIDPFANMSKGNKLELG